jgi:hypothetical protein
MDSIQGAVRGFFIALAAGVGIPLIFILLAIAIPAAAMLYAYTIAPQLAYMYPVTFLLPNAGSSGGWLSIVQMVVLSALFGIATRHRKAGAQFLWAVVALGAWWLIWRVVGLVSGLEPDLHVRM